MSSASLPQRGAQGCWGDSGERSFMKLPRAVLYYRSSCASCEEARRILERVRPHQPFELEEIDVEEDPVACALHGDKTPVLSIQGQVAFRHSLDEDRLMRRLRQAAEALAFEEEQARRRRQGDEG